MLGSLLPHIRTAPPGPRSHELARRLSRVESRNITRIDDTIAPIFWEEARGANVRDVDGNVYVDLTGGFAVAAAGHANASVAEAIAQQAGRLPHALGDVHPAPQKVELLEKLVQIAPGGLEAGILASAGAEAVEAALKTALLATGRPGVVAFRNAYHGLTYGALATTWRTDFRDPFAAQLFGGVRFAPFPDPYRLGGQSALGSPAEGGATRLALDAVREAIADAHDGEHPIGAVLVEPVQGRGGVVVPPLEFLPGLRALCDESDVLLILDEIYTGLGRTGRWFACEHAGVRPDILVIGKALAGGLPLSAALGTRAVMDAWPPSSGEAIHTSTFLGNPIACAAALANLREIEQHGLLARAAQLGKHVARRCAAWADRFEIVGDTRGMGLLRGIELVTDRQTKRPATEITGRIVEALLQHGILILAEGSDANVLAITPPLTISEQQLDHALDVIEEELTHQPSAT